MKRISLVALPAIGAFFTLFAQKIAINKVPPATRTAFEKLYPGITANWEKENGRYEAHFKKNSVPWSVLMDDKGTLYERETTINVNELPANTLSYLKEKYKGKPIKESAKITKADGTVNYEANIGGKDIIFDARGKFLKVVKD